MAPIHDTDVAKERWNTEGWKTYELWEKIETRVRRVKIYWIITTVLVFILLSSIPVIIIQWPKWKTLSIARELSFELTIMKRRAAIEQSVYRLRLDTIDGKIVSLLEKGSQCADSNSGISSFRPVSQKNYGLASETIWISPEISQELKLPSIVKEVCYHPLSGLQPPTLQAMGIVPVKDLADSNLERASIVIVEGNTSEIVFQ